LDIQPVECRIENQLVDVFRESWNASGLFVCREPLKGRFYFGCACCYMCASAPEGVIDCEVEGTCVIEGPSRLFGVKYFSRPATIIFPGFEIT
jgi:hypothetical protein